MKNITLKELELTNYRNIEYAHYHFDGNSKIIGENRIGKTNTLESIYWLLTDKLLDGSSEVSAIKPLKDTKLEVRVKAVFDIDGKEVTLEKTYKENWVKTRGTSDLEMKGHSITWIHNGVKQGTLKAYNQLVSEDFGFTQDATTKIDFMQMLINPFYLGNIGESKDWTELRAFIIKLVGDVSDEDVTKTDEKFIPIKKDLDSVGGRVDQLKKKYTADIDELKTSIISDDAQIELLEKTPNPTDDELAVAKKGIEEHQEKINALKNANGVDIASMEINNKINDKKLEISELEREDALNNSSNSKKEKINEEINELRKEKLVIFENKSNTLSEMTDLKFKLKNKQNDLSTNQQLRLSLINELKDIDAKTKNPEFEHECPHCHREYEKSEIESRKEQSLLQLETKRNELIAKGVQTRSLIDSLQNDIDSLSNEIKTKESKIDEFTKTLNEKTDLITKKQEELDSIVVEVVSNPQISILKSEIEKLEEEYKLSREKYSSGIQNNQQLIFDEEEAMQPFQKILADREYYKRQMSQLETTKKMKQTHVNLLTDLEQRKELLNSFIYKKLKMLDENVSSVFGNIKFQLIKENINGGFDTICKPYIFDSLKNESSNSSWKSGSKSERVITGIAIVEKIKEKLGLPNLPYLFDEGGEISTETFNNRMKTESQIICVKVVDNLVSPLIQKL